MRGVTPENYQKVRTVSKLNAETIFESLKVEKDHQTELCGIIPQEMELRFSHINEYTNHKSEQYILKFDGALVFEPKKSRTIAKASHAESFCKKMKLDYF